MRNTAVLEFDLSNPDEEKQYRVALKSGHYIQVLARVVAKIDNADKDNLTFPELKGFIKGLLEDGDK